MKMRGTITVLLAIIFIAISFAVSAQDVFLPQVQNALLAPVPPAPTPSPSFDETLATMPAPPVIESQPSALQIQFNQAEIQPAPEPSTFALGILAIGLIALVRLNKRQQI
jgi:hypothetical protein